MKKLTAGFMGITFFLCASVCSAAYLIHLKDGREIVTTEYWEEDGQIKIKQYGGVVGIAREDVLSIEKSDDVRTVIIKSPPERKTEAADEKAEAPPKKEEKQKKVDNTPEEKKPEEAEKAKAPKEKNSLLKRLDALKERFKTVEKMSKDEIIQFDKALADLRNRIIQAGLAGPYADQMVEILEMGSKAEEVLKKRGQ